MSDIHDEHGPDCTCGCHEGKHEHDHAGHGHDHRHDHRHDHAEGRTRAIELGWADVALESHVHEQASTVSATIPAHAESGKTFEALIEALRITSENIEAAGGIMGHIKAYARSGESFAHASATDAQHEPTCEGDVQLPLEPDVQTQLVAIALLIGLDDLESIVVEALK